MQNLEVGKPYKEGLKRIPEGIVFNFNQDGGFIRIVFNSPLDSEIKEITQGKIKLQYFAKNLFLIFSHHRFTSDTPPLT
jgi:hypothetical protein